jgi:hypothetical protein
LNKTKEIGKKNVKSDTENENVVLIGHDFTDKKMEKIQEKYILLD